MKQPPRPCRIDTRPLRRARPAARQHGSIAVLAAVCISVAVILLASIDIGYLFFQKRELQKIADLSALAGAQQLARSNLLLNDQCASAYRVASDNARVGQSFTGATTVSCGKWDPATGPTPTYYSAYAGGVTPAGQTAPNAISVQVTQTFGSFFGAWTGQQVAASAIAVTDAPTAVFSVGSKLLQIGSNGVVPGLLTALGIDISGTSLVSYNGLANVSVTPSGLLSALGFNIPLTADVGTIKQLLQINTGSCSNGSCTLRSVLTALSVGSLGLPNTQLDLPVKLLSDAAGRGLFTLADTADGSSALQTNVNALDLLTASLGVANSHRAVDAGITVAGIASVKVGIVEPPSIGIGGIGTTAYTAQVRLFSRIQAGLPGVLSVDLPLAIDVVDGQGTITDMCTVKDSNGNDTATIDVTASILKVCVGDIDANAIFSTQGSCSANLQPKTLISVLGILNALTLTTHFSIDALPSNGSATLSKGQTATVGDNNLQIGATVGTLLQTVLTTLVAKIQILGSDILSFLLLPLLSSIGTLLTPILNSLGDALATLLSNLLGVQLGPVDVNLIDLNCGGGPHVRLVH